MVQRWNEFYKISSEDSEFRVEKWCKSYLRGRIVIKESKLQYKKFGTKFRVEKIVQKYELRLNNLSFSSENLKVSSECEVVQKEELRLIKNNLIVWII